MENDPGSNSQNYDSLRQLMANGISDYRFKNTLEEAAQAAESLDPAEKYRRLMALAEHAELLDASLQYGVQYGIYNQILAIPELQTNPYLLLHVRGLQLDILKRDYNQLSLQFDNNEDTFMVRRQETLERIVENTKSVLAFSDERPEIRIHNRLYYRRSQATAAWLLKHPISQRQFKD